MKPQLLCTFTDNTNLLTCLKQINKTYSSEGVKVDIYTHDSGVVCIYNVVDKTKRIQDTISINKKKETNTYYSINALNALIIALNNGVLDKTYSVNWHNYVDSLLLANGNGYKCTKLVRLNHL